MVTAFLESLFVTVSSLYHRRPAKAQPPTETEAKPGFNLGRTLSFGEAQAGEQVVIEDAVRQKHLLLLGQSACGKSTAFYRLLDYDRAQGRTLVSISYRSDALRRSLVRLMAAGVPAEQITVIDVGEQDFIWPMDFLGSGAGDPYARAGVAYEALESESARFGVQVSTDVRMAVTVCALCGLGFTELERLLSAEGSSLRLALMPKLPGFLQDSLFSYESLSPEMQRVRCGTVVNKVSAYLFTPMLQATFGLPQAPDLVTMLDLKGHITCINLAEDRQPAAGLLGRLLIGSIQKHVLGRVDLPEAELNPVTLLVDEFQNIATPSFAQILCESRKYSLGVCLGHQHFSQVPPLLRDSERLNIFSQCYFSTSAVDAKDVASEVSSSLSREEVKQTITALPVGCCLFVQRGTPTRKVQMPDSKDPKVDPERLAQFKREIMARTGIPRAEAEAQLAQRREALRALAGAPEVTHERKPRPRRIA